MADKTCIPGTRPADALGPLRGRERIRAWEELVAPLDVRCVDAYEVRKQHPHAPLNGFESEPYAIQWAHFAEVLYLDADNVPVRDPTYHRVGYDHRPLPFRGGETFSAGGAGCERYWTIRDGRMLIAGDDWRLTMDLAATADGGWRVGRSLVGS